MHFNKRYAIGFIILLLILSLCACGNIDTQPAQTTDLSATSTSAAIDPPTVEAAPIYLQSASHKNQYIKTDTMTVATMVEPSRRAFVFETGLADESGISLRLSESDRYLACQNGVLTAIVITTDNDKKAATFFEDDALALPTWASDGALFKSFRLMNTESYLTNQNGTLALTDGSDKLAATFKLTEDQTAVPPNFRGTTYCPAYALNSAQFFKWYDHAIIERDMTRARELGINALHIQLSYEYWRDDPTHFETCYNDFLALAESYSIKVMVSLFECGEGLVDYDSSAALSRDYEIARKIASPSADVYTDKSRWDEPKAFVSWFFENYKNDSRLMAIAIYRKPNRECEPLTEYLTAHAATLQGSVPLTPASFFATSNETAEAAALGADFLLYHDSFPNTRDSFEKNAKKLIDSARLANLPLYYTDVLWDGAPTVNYPLYRTLIPTVNDLAKDNTFAAFYQTLIVHPAYQNQKPYTVGFLQENGGFYSYADALALFPDYDLSDAVIDPHNPFLDKAYTYRYLFSDDFSDRHGYKWTVKNGAFDASNDSYVGQGTCFANATAFSDFTATLSVSFDSEASFIFRAKDETNYYLATVSRESYAIYKVVNGEKTLLLSKVPEDAGKSFTVTISATGDELRLSANCTDVNVTDKTFTVGAIGFFAPTVATFDALHVFALFS